MKRRIRWDRLTAVVTAAAVTIGMFAWACHVPEPTPEQWAAHVAHIHAQKAEFRK